MRIIFVVNKKQTEVEITSLLGTKRNAAPPRHFVINSLRVITFVFRINKEQFLVPYLCLWYSFIFVLSSLLNSSYIYPNYIVAAVSMQIETCENLYDSLSTRPFILSPFCVLELPEIKIIIPSLSDNEIYYSYSYLICNQNHTQEI